MLQRSLVYEEWGDHEAVLLRPVQEPAWRELCVPRSVVLSAGSSLLKLELGGVLPEVEVRFETYGRLSAARDNAVLVFHALTGSAHLAGQYDQATLERLSPLEQAFGAQGWWDAQVGPGRPLDPERYYIISANLLGSCYGTTGPTSKNPLSQQAYGPDFPELTMRDLARVQARLLDYLGVNRVRVLGSSMGGMVALEFAIMFPERTRRALVVAAPARQGPWARGFARAGREAILNDPAYTGGRYIGQPPGLAAAREIAMLSYRSPQSFSRRWREEPAAGESYLAYQGRKFRGRFDAQAYLALTMAMDRHDISRDRSSIPEVLAGLRTDVDFVGIDSDLLYPASEVREAAGLVGGDYAELKSLHGHDAFLIEHAQVAALLWRFLER